MRKMSKKRKHEEREETPAEEARSHSKGFLEKAARMKKRGKKKRGGRRG